MVRPGHSNAVCTRWIRPVAIIAPTGGHHRLFDRWPSQLRPVAIIAYVSRYFLCVAEINCADIDCKRNSFASKNVHLWVDGGEAGGTTQKRNVRRGDQEPGRVISYRVADDHLLECSLSYVQLSVLH